MTVASRRTRETLSDPVKVALLALRGRIAIINDSGLATIEGGGKIHIRVLMALYDRYLVAIRIEAGPRRYKYAILTDIGEHAARGVLADAAAVDDFEDSPNVYGDQPDDAVV